MTSWKEEAMAMEQEESRAREREREREKPFFSERFVQSS
jgi:hypothetical protein